MINLISKKKINDMTLNDVWALQKAINVIDNKKQRLADVADDVAESTINGEIGEVYFTVTIKMNKKDDHWWSYTLYKSKNNNIIEECGITELDAYRILLQADSFVS